MDKKAKVLIGVAAVTSCVVIGYGVFNTHLKEKSVQKMEENYFARNWRHAKDHSRWISF